MAKVILLCGKVGSGKTTYARKLLKERTAVLLSADEIMLSLFGNDAGDMHHYYSERTQRYLFDKSLEILVQDIDVILDWGFWTKTSREAAKRFYSDAGFESELHYINVSENDWHQNLTERNKAFAEGDRTVYYMDDDTANLFAARFDPPDSNEIDKIFNNIR